jgi:hypothetical protein
MSRTQPLRPLRVLSRRIDTSLVTLTVSAIGDISLEVRGRRGHPVVLPLGDDDLVVFAAALHTARQQAQMRRRTLFPRSVCP